VLGLEGERAENGFGSNDIAVRQISCISAISHLIR
jgi:hypothetical protein